MTAVLSTEITTMPTIRSRLKIRQKIRMHGFSTLSDKKPRANLRPEFNGAAKVLKVKSSSIGSVRSMMGRSYVVRGGSYVANNNGPWLFLVRS